MDKIKPVVLDIQNVSQKLNIDDISMKKNIGQKLKSMIIEQTQEKLENGNLKITLILDPKITEVKTHG